MLQICFKMLQMALKSGKLTHNPKITLYTSVASCHNFPHEQHTTKEMRGGYFGCGFMNMEQLSDWFKPNELDKLAKHGYEIVTIEPDEIIATSENQTVFWCKKPLRMVAKSLAA